MSKTLIDERQAVREMVAHRLVVAAWGADARLERASALDRERFLNHAEALLVELEDAGCLAPAAVALAARLAAVEALHHPSTDHGDGMKRIGRPLSVCHLLSDKRTAWFISTDHGDGMKPYCVGCWEACGEEGAPLWPCPTIRALRAALRADSSEAPA